MTFLQLASAIKTSDAAKPAEAAKEKAGAGAATTPAPAAETAAATAPTPTPSLVNLELTPEMTSDNPLETRNLAFYTQTIGEGKTKKKRKKKEDAFIFGIFYQLPYSSSIMKLSSNGSVQRFLLYFFVTGINTILTLQNGMLI